MYSVYMFIFPSNKVYVGLTKQSVKDRWRNGNAYSHSVFVNNAIKKYGWENIEKVVLYDDLTREQAMQKEIELIEWFNSTNREFGYNLSIGGESKSGVPMSEETKDYLRCLRLGTTLSEETKRKIGERELGANNPMARKVICLETMKVYDTLTQAQKETGATKISDCCRHTKKHKSSNGLHWEYYDEYLSEQDYKDILEWLVEEENENKHHKMSDENKKKLVDMCSVSVVCVETGEMFNSIADACRVYNVSPSDVCYCCKGKRKTAKGFRWEYASVAPA